MANQQYKAEYDEAYRAASELVIKVSDMLIHDYQGRLTEEQNQLIEKQEQALKQFREAEKKYFGDE